MPKDPKHDPDATLIPGGPRSKGKDGDWPTVLDAPKGKPADLDTTLRDGPKRSVDTQPIPSAPEPPPDTLRTNDLQRGVETIPPKSKAQAPKGTFILPPESKYRAEEPKPPLLDKNTRLAIFGAASVTLLIGVVAWKLLGPAKAPPPPKLNIPTAVTTVSDNGRPEKPVANKVAVSPDAIMIEDRVDAGAGQLRTVKVEGATVQISSALEVTLSRNGVELGKTPLLVTLPVGTLTLQAVNRAEGLSRTVTIEVEQKPNQSKRLEFPKGHIEVRAPAGTKISLDGRAVGQGPQVTVSAWPGAHVIDVTFPGGDKDSRKVDLQAGDNANTEFEAPVKDEQLAQ